MTSLILIGSVVHVLYGIVLFLTSLFLILLVLIQRGRGGGLSGAFGGMGGQSAFGAKAGDTFTKVTIVVASFWIVLCLLGVKFLGNATGPRMLIDRPEVPGPLQPGLEPPEGGIPATDPSSSATETGSDTGTAEPPATPSETPSETPADSSGEDDSNR